MCFNKIILNRFFLFKEKARKKIKKRAVLSLSKGRTVRCPISENISTPFWGLHRLFTTIEFSLCSKGKYRTFFTR